MVHRDEYRQMVLAGTVSFPATFPQVGKLTLQREKLPASDEPEVVFLSVTESPSARVTLVRRVMIKAVRAIFIPRDPRHVNYADGEWLLMDEILPALSSLFDNYDALRGIAFVPESEPSLLNVSVGMTAGESVQYYPPLPNDPAHNHYNAWPTNSASQAVQAAPDDALHVRSCNPLSKIPDPQSCEQMPPCEQMLIAEPLQACQVPQSCEQVDKSNQFLAASLDRAALSCVVGDGVTPAHFQAMAQPHVAALAVHNLANQQAAAQSLAAQALAACNAYPTEY